MFYLCTYSSNCIQERCFNVWSKTTFQAHILVCALSLLQLISLIFILFSVFISNSIQYYRSRKFLPIVKLTFVFTDFNVCEAFLNFSYWTVVLRALFSFDLSPEGHPQRALLGALPCACVMPPSVLAARDSCCSNCSRGTSRKGHTWEFGGNASCQVWTQIYWIWISILRSSLDDCIYTGWEVVS